MTLKPDADTLFRRLRDTGYRVACLGKTDLQKHGGWQGRDGWSRALGQLGFTESRNQCDKWGAVGLGVRDPQDLYMSLLYDRGLARAHIGDYQHRNALRRDTGQRSAWPSPLPCDAYTDDVCGGGAGALDLLRGGDPSPGDRDPAPWMLWVNFPDPHEPFDPPGELQRRYEGVKFPPPVAVPDSAPHQNHAQLRHNYAALCEGIDDWVGRLIAELEARDERDQSLVIFSSDHGELLADHGRWYKGTPDEGSVHVPLTLAGPGIPAGAIREDPVELIDIAAEVLHEPDWDARRLMGRGPRRRVQRRALGDGRMTRDGRWKLVERTAADPQLFDLREDPAELCDVALQKPEEVQRLRDLVASGE